MRRAGIPRHAALSRTALRWFAFGLPAAALAVFLAVAFPLLPAGAEEGMDLTRRLTFGQLASDQGRLTALPGTQCAGELRTGVTIERAITSGGLERTYRLYMPGSVEQGVPVPLVLNFHALAADGEIQEALSQLKPIADREGFILVSPDAYGSPRGWNALLNESWTVDDVQFVDDLLDELLQSYCVDVRRVYATGFSSGGMLSSRIGCRLGTRFAAVAPVAGVYAPEDFCVGVAPMLAIHGTGDDVVPFSGGLAVGVPYDGARGEIEQWARNVARCSGNLQSSTLGPGITLEEYGGCGRQDTALVVIENLGHAPPNGAVADLIWAFFEDHRLTYHPFQ